MCGIAGFVSYHQHDRNEAMLRVRKMTNSLAHRGPDEEGYYVDDMVALGHRRLSIIDLKHGQQPMSGLGGRVRIVFNGEIYNFFELKAELISKGHAFHTKSDTEVILQAYVEWGENCVEKLNGMFAFAIWDERNSGLFMARDRVGKKPLYYTRQGNKFAFASELKAIKTIDMCPNNLDPQSLDCYFSLGYIPAPRTIFKNVQKLPAGRCISIFEKSEKERRYWELKFNNSYKLRFCEAVDEFQYLLDKAVKCRLMSEVPLGCFLSGGLDSSLVVASMSRLMDKAVKTNSIGFPDYEFSELPIARAISEHIGTEHYEKIVTPQITDDLIRISTFFDEPFADSSAVPTWYVSQAAKEQVTVALSGDGGDESFGGYTFRYVPHMIESKIRRLLPQKMRRVVFGLMGRGWPDSAKLPKYLRLKTIWENLAVTDAMAFYNDLIWLRDDTRKELYANGFLESLDDFTPYDIVRPFYDGSGAADALSCSQHADINVYMAEDVLVKVDRMSMAHSLEVRSPFLDYRLIEFAASLPPEFKIKYGKGKRILRKIAARQLPLDISKRPKTGFSIPAAQWLRRELSDIAQQIIFKKHGMLSDFLNKKVLLRLWNEHQSGYKDHSVTLWGLMMLGLWEQHFLNGR